MTNKRCEQILGAGINLVYVCAVQEQSRNASDNAMYYVQRGLYGLARQYQREARTYALRLSVLMGNLIDED